MSSHGGSYKLTLSSEANAPPAGNTTITLLLEAAAAITTTWHFYVSVPSDCGVIGIGRGKKRREVGKHTLLPLSCDPVRRSGGFAALGPCYSESPFSLCGRCPGKLSTPFLQELPCFPLYSSLLSLAVGLRFLNVRMVLYGVFLMT